ncbi:MAG: rhomboid family intramembrane serine protease, partial [Myxococcales bacterium]
LERFHVWTLATYLFIELQPFSLLLHILFPLWMFASQLERQWGTKRFVWYMAATGVGGALVALLLSLVAPSMRPLPYFGTWVVADAAILAWVLMNWHATVYLLFFPVRAPYLLVPALGIPALYIIQGHWQQFIPVLAAMGIGYLLMQRRGLSVRRGYLQFRAWWIDRQLRQKARHLRLVPPPDRDGPDKKNQYLH